MVHSRQHPMIHNIIIIPKVDYLHVSPPCGPLCVQVYVLGCWLQCTTWSLLILELCRAHTPRAASASRSVYTALLTIFTYTIYQVVRMCIKHMGVQLIGVANKIPYLGRSWTLPNDSKHNEGGFSTISTDSLYLRVAQVPRYRDLAIFVLTTDDRQNRLLYPCCACAHAG